MNIALIAHDKKKELIIDFCKKFKNKFAKHNLYATGTTGAMIRENVGLEITCLKSGPMGGDQEIGGMIANGKIDMVIFMRDPLTSMPHEPDISALLRLCDVYNIPLATNLETAKLFVNNL